MQQYEFTRFALYSQIRDGGQWKPRFEKTFINPVRIRIQNFVNLPELKRSFLPQ